MYGALPDRQINHRSRGNSGGYYLKALPKFSMSTVIIPVRKICRVDMAQSKWRFYCVKKRWNQNAPFFCFVCFSYNPFRSDGKVRPGNEDTARFIQPLFDITPPTLPRRNLKIPENAPAMFLQLFDYRLNPFQVFAGIADKNIGFELSLGWHLCAVVTDG